MSLLISMASSQADAAEMAQSKIAGAILESPTFALNEQARLLRARGAAVINMGIGEPVNKTPLSAVIA